jgi:membrane protein YdbS with pleckstrin-like domain
MEQNDEFKSEVAPFEALSQLHPNYISALRVQTTLFATVALTGAFLVEHSGALSPGFVMLPVLILSIAAIIRLPSRRYFARGYIMGDDRLSVVRGILFRRDTVVPFGRVQHIDVHQGPIARFFGIASLTLHTAGSHNASVTLPGLEEKIARAMRDEIRNHIKRKML